MISKSKRPGCSKCRYSQNGCGTCRSQRQEEAPDEASVVGRMIEVYWPLDKCYYKGRVTNVLRGRYEVSYDDGDKEWIGSQRATYRWLPGGVAKNDGKAQSDHPSTADVKRSMRVKDRQDTAKQSKPADESHVGRRVEIYWPMDKAFYAGTLLEHRGGGKYKVKYDDGEEEIILLAKQTYNWLPPQPARGGKTRVSMSSRLAPKARNVEKKLAWLHNNYETADEKVRPCSVPGGLDENIIGRRIEVHWPLDHCYYKGAVTGSLPGRYRVAYDDGDQEWIWLKKTAYKWLPDDTLQLLQREKAQSYHPGAADVKRSMRVKERQDPKDTAKESKSAGESHVGRRVEIYWPKDKAFYPGTLTAHSRGGKYKVKYDDGEEETILLAKQTYNWLPAKPTRGRKTRVSMSSKMAIKTPVLSRVRRGIQESGQDSGTPAPQKKKAACQPSSSTTSLIGRCIEIYFSEQQQWCPGTISDFRAGSSKHQITFADGKKKWLKLSDIKHNVLPTSAEPVENITGVKRKAAVTVHMQMEGRAAEDVHRAKTRLNDKRQLLLDNSESLKSCIINSPSPPRRKSLANAPPPPPLQIDEEPQQLLQEVLPGWSDASPSQSALSVPLALPHQVSSEQLPPTIPLAEKPSDDGDVQSRSPIRPLVISSSPTHSQEIDELPADVDWWNPLDVSKVLQVKQALHVSGITHQGIPICREKQAASLDQWLGDRLRNAQGGSAYVGGVPGSGKSLTIRAVLRNCATHMNVEGSKCTAPPALIAVNCMSLTEPLQIVSHILSGWYGSCSQPFMAGDSIDDPIVYAPMSGAYAANPRRSSSGYKTLLEELTSIVMRPNLTTEEDRSSRRTSMNNKRHSMGGSTDRGMLVVALDELDGLLIGRTGDSVVEELFALAHAPGSRLLIIGIANQVDLIQQLTRAGSAFHRLNVKPHSEVFTAYTKESIHKILIQRLSTLPGAVFEPKAIELCSTRFAKGFADIRRAFEAATKAVDLAVEAASKAGAEESSTLITPRQMYTAINIVTGGMGISNNNVQAIKQLPPPQQLLMAIIGKMLADSANPLGGDGHQLKPFHLNSSNGGNKTMGLMPPPTAHLNPLSRRRSSIGAGARGSKDITLGQLEDTHAKLCSLIGLTPYTGPEFVTAVTILEDLGLIGVLSAKESKRQRVTIRVSEDDITFALENAPVINNGMRHYFGSVCC